MVGISDWQRADIDVIRGQYQSEFAERRRRIGELPPQKIYEYEFILTEARRKLLAQLRDARRPPLSSDSN